MIAKGAKRMKRISLIVTAGLTLALLITAYSRPPQTGAVKKVSVTTQTVASQAAGKPYVIDLTRSGTVYEIDAKVNSSQVQVRTEKGTQALSSLMKTASTSKFLLGWGKDLNALNFGFPPGNTFPSTGGVRRDATCGGGYCTCSGPKDCKDLNDSGLCYEGWNCSTVNGQWGCSCFQKTK
jgi:hypothetical protein